MVSVLKELLFQQPIFCIYILTHIIKCRQLQQPASTNLAGFKTLQELYHFYKCFFKNSYQMHLTDLVTDLSNMMIKRVCEPGISKCLKLIHSYYESVYWVLLIFQVKIKSELKVLRTTVQRTLSRAQLRKPRAYNIDDCYTDL